VRHPVHDIRWTTGCYPFEYLKLTRVRAHRGIDCSIATALTSADRSSIARSISWRALKCCLEFGHPESRPQRRSVRVRTSTTRNNEPGNTPDECNAYRNACSLAGHSNYARCDCLSRRINDLARPLAQSAGNRLLEGRHNDLTQRCFGFRCTHERRSK
jgi:hypothetical protein